MCFFNFKYSGLLPFSVFPRCQCVCTHQAGRTSALQQSWQSSEKSQNFKEKHNIQWTPCIYKMQSDYISFYQMRCLYYIGTIAVKYRDFQAVREEQNWYSKLSIHGNPDSNFGVNFLAYIMLLFTISLVQYMLWRVDLQ